MAAGFIQLPADGLGKKLRTNDRGATGHDQYVIATDERVLSYRGRANSFATLAIAGTVGHNLMSIHNAAGSAVLVDVQKVWVDLMSTASRVVEQAKIRLHRITTLPTGGTALAKVPMDTARSSSASVTLLQATASDNGAATAITSSPAAGSVLVQEWAPRLLTAVGYEQFDRALYFEDTKVTLRPLEGILLRLDYTVATASPITDKWLCGLEWDEYTLP